VAVRYPGRRIAVNVLCCSWSDPRAIALLIAASTGSRGSPTGGGHHRAGNRL